MKKILMTILCCLCICLVSCREKEKSIFTINIDDVYLSIDDNNYVAVTKESTISYSDNLYLIYSIHWKYVINNVKDLKDLPIIECSYPVPFSFDVYLNDEIIKTSKTNENELQALNYNIEHCFLHSNIYYTIDSSGRISIDSSGNYKIVYYFVFKVNGEEIECLDSFEFAVI